MPGSRANEAHLVGQRWSPASASSSWTRRLVWLLLVVLINTIDLDRRSVQSKLVNDSGSFVTYECDNDVDETGVRETCDVSITRSMLNNRSIVFQSQWSQLKQIKCNKCRIGRMRHSAGLSFSMNVQTIDLSLSAIRSIGAGAIAGTFNVLTLSFNELTELNEAKIFAQIPQLEAIYLDYNQLHHIDDQAFDGIPRLVRLYLSHNKLVTMPSRSFAHLPNLMSLRLDNNHLETLDADLFAANPRLTELTLYDNRLAIVADEVWPRLHKIDMLDVDNVRLQVEQFREKEVPENETTFARSDCEIGLEDGIIIQSDQLFNRSCSNLNEVPTEDLIHGSQYKHINLRHNGIRIIKERAFGQVAPSMVVTLDLTHNQISTIHPAAFNELVNLEVLLLSDNIIETISTTAFSNLAYLLVLELHDNALYTIQTNLFWHNIRLTRLRLGNNRIAEVESHTFDQLQQLVFFDLANNFIENDVLISINAKQVVLHNANVSYLTLGDRCQQVDASSNRIVSLNTKDAVSLLELNVSANHLVTIDVSQSKSLEMIDVSRNRLGHLSFLYNSFLVDVNLANNFITEVRFAQASHLQRLDLSGNSLESLYLPGQTTFNLIHLNMSNNQIKSLDPFIPLYTLRELDISSNPIQELTVTTFQNMELLERLILQNTQLSAIPAGLFEHQTSLEFLDVSHNNISIVDNAAVAGLKSCKVLRVDGNNLTSIDWRIIQMLPRLERIEVSNNEWRCDALGEFVRMMEDNFVNVPSDRVGVRGASVHGIRCNVEVLDGDDEHEEGEDGADAELEYQQHVLDGGGSCAGVLSVYYVALAVSSSFLWF